MNNGYHHKIRNLEFIVNKYEDSSEGVFDWGVERDNLFERFCSADELSNPELAKHELKEIIQEDPEFIDAYNRLGWWEIEFQNYGNAKSFFEKAFLIGKRLIPKNFDGEIMWGIIDNRPFLRAMYGLGVCYQLTHNNEKALELFDNILKYNENDNQGARFLAIQSNLALGHFSKVIDICNKYDYDVSADILYGRVLAYHKLARFRKAQSSLKNAIEYLPLVAQELVKDRHNKIKGEYPGRITHGGEDEAYEYWERVGQFWTDPNLTTFLKKGIDLYTNKKRKN